MRATEILLSCLVALGDPVPDPLEKNGSPTGQVRKETLACPLCGGAVPHPGVCRGGQNAMAECERCDILFDPSDVEGLRGVRHYVGA
jgi:hypothetical protein